MNIAVRHRRDVLPSVHREHEIDESHQNSGEYRSQTPLAELGCLFLKIFLEGFFHRVLDESFAFFHVSPFIFVLHVVSR